jgi:hypothetical protein
LKKLTNKIKRIDLIGNSEKVSCAAAVSKAAGLILAADRKVYSAFFETLGVNLHWRGANL